MKKILITGVNGQLGNEMRVLFESYPQFEFFPTDINELDLCNKQAIDNFITENKINYIVNCTAYTAVDKAEDEIEEIKWTTRKYAGTYLKMTMNTFSCPACATGWMLAAKRTS